MTAADTEIARKELNKEIIRRSFEEYFHHKNLDYGMEFIHENFVQHSPDAPSGRQAYLDFLRNSPLRDATTHIKRLVADGDYVAIHHNLLMPGDEGPGLAVIDLWRFEDGLVVEHWDVTQPIPEDPSRIPNGMV